MMDLLSFVLENRQKGFTLIETALAMLAIGLGLLAIFGLGRLGLQTAKETEYDQRCAMMADAIFETLRDYNAYFIEAARTNNVSGQTPKTWWTYWSETREAEKSGIPFPLVAGISRHVYDLDLNFSGNATPTYDPKNISLGDWHPWYALVVNPFAASPVANDYTSLKVELAIFPDGETLLSSDPRVFTTTLTNPGGLP